MYLLKLFNKKNNNEIPVFSNDLVGCIGKMPMHVEFIKHHVTRPEIASLDQWYQTAYHELNRQFNDKVKMVFSRMPIYHFMYTSTKTHDPIIGTLAPSHDKSGRAYPFVVFRFVENPVAKEFQVTVPMLYKDCYGAIDALCQSDWREKTLTELFHAVDDLNQTVTRISRRTALESAVNILTELTFNQFWELLKINYPELTKPTLVRTVLTRFCRCKNSVDDLPWGLRLPLTGDEKHIHGVIFWMQLIDVLLPDKAYLIQAFWNLAIPNHPPSLTVFFKPMKPGFLAHLVNNQFVDDNFTDFTRISKYADKTETEINAAMNHSDFTLLETLDHWTKPQFLEQFNNK